MSIKYQKAKTLFDEFDRKGGGKVSHYCPGCGHGVAHNLIAEAIDQLGVQDQVVFCSPVGCAVFGYYYFDTGNIQCSHGRAPAVASSIRRTHPEAVIISYQGDGDLAGIGLSHILHAANRGENITVFFINNAIYGMTGGQMAPTTLLGQRTQTTPNGRVELNDGDPIGMCELVSQLAPVTYVERVSLADTKRIMQARKAIKKGLECQVNGKGFSFVEILSPCPINWKMDSIQAREWMISTLEPSFPLRTFVDRIEERAPECFRPAGTQELSDEAMLDILIGDHIIPSAAPQDIDDQKVKIAGLGGMGVLTAGSMLAACATTSNLYNSWVPSYGPEMRGGNAFVSVYISKDPIASPVFTDPTTLIALSNTAIDTYVESITPQGYLFYNSSIVDREIRRKDIKVYKVPASEMALSLNMPATQTTIMLTVYALITGVVTMDSIRDAMKQKFKKKNILDANLAAIDLAIKYSLEQQWITEDYHVCR